MMVQSGSVSQSIGFDTNGNLDTGSLLTFAGSGNAFVKIWYDQSGNGKDDFELEKAYIHISDKRLDFIKKIVEKCDSNTLLLFHLWLNLNS